jgi:carbon monoxide dehydrogenase subunit G
MLLKTPSKSGTQGSTAAPIEVEPLYCATFSREMQLENSFQVSASPDRVFEYLLDINRVVGCVPGAELSEVVDPSTFKGKVKVKVGPISVAYNGTARISERSESDRSAVLVDEGRETTGQGTAKATARMTVEPAADGSTVRIVTEYHIAGRVAQFGRGVMEDVSKRIVREMADCIKANLESVPTAQPGPSSPDTAMNSVATHQPVATARQISVFALLVHLISVRIQRLFQPRG